MRQWKLAGIVSEGQAIRFRGVNPWNHEWVTLNEPDVELPHPTYPNQLHAMSIYQIDSGGRSITFAAGEVSANVWGFYVAA